MRIGTRPNCYFRSDEGIRESDFRCTPETVFVVPMSAYTFKRQNWHEFSGMADGFCDVTDHPEWSAIYAWLLENMTPRYYADKDVSKHGPSYLITVDTEDGKCCHVGSIHRSNGRLEIGG